MLTTPSGNVEAGGTRVTAGFFRTLGVKPILGRDFTDGEDQPAAQRAVILSYATWNNRYAANPNVLGQSVILDGRPTPSSESCRPIFISHRWAALNSGPRSTPLTIAIRVAAATVTWASGA